MQPLLSETHLDSYLAECLRKRLKMDQKCVCPSNGRRGGLALFWNNNVHVHRLALDPMFIDVKIDDNNTVWRLTGMYGEFRWENKHITWQRMRQLHQGHNLPLLLMGDLNEIQYLHEKEEGNPRPVQYMQAFQEAIDDCELHDPGFIGDPFTWCRGRIRERLDRGLVNDAWMGLFPHAALQNLEYNHLDHRPLFIDTEYYVQQGGTSNNNHVKRFEVRWLREEKFDETVMEAWTEAATDPNLTNIYEKLNKMHARFHDWDQRVLKKPKKRLRKAQRELERVMAGPMNDANYEKRKELAELIEYLLELEEIQVMQRSRATWLTSGDRNTFVATKSGSSEAYFGC